MAEKPPPLFPPTSDVLQSSKLLQLLDCPVCLQVPEPPILLCQQGHSICQKCRLKLIRCPLCQEDFSTARNLLAEQLVQSLQRKCPYAKEGCESNVPAYEWDAHAAQCDFRQVECDLLQRKTCYNVKMNYKKYFTHLTNVHLVQGIKGTILNVSQFVTFQQSHLTSEMPHGMWPVQYLEACNEVFLTGTSAVPGKVFWWVYIIGNAETASKYFTKVSLNLKSKGYEQSWTGPVHSFRSSPERILEQGLCLLATPETLSPFTYMKVQQSTHPEENQPNVGWNLTFSIMKKEKIFTTSSTAAATRSSITFSNRSVKTSSVSSTSDLDLRLADMKISPSPVTRLSPNNIALQHLPIKLEPLSPSPLMLGNPKTEISSPESVGSSSSQSNSSQQIKKPANKIKKDKSNNSLFNISG